jgi:hypothetical protein
MTEINPQQILIEQLKKISNNKELIDLAVTLVESKQNIIKFSYGNAYVLWDTETNTTFNNDEANFTDLLSHVAYNNIDKLTVINACQYPDLTEGCVRYLYFSGINVYYKITINQIKYSCSLTKDSYKRYQEFWFNYLNFSAYAWDGDDNRALVIYGINRMDTTKNAELFVIEEALLNKYKTALIMT